MLNYLRITIRKVKVINDNNTQTFNLKIDLFNQTQELEKLSSPETQLNKVFITLKIKNNQQSKKIYTQNI